jgi:methionine-rich copper-binding protein CopC
MRNLQIFALLLPLKLIHAHALLLDATPKANSIIEKRETIIRLKFNSRIDAKRSKLVLYFPNGASRVLPLESSPEPDSLAATVDGLAPGLHKIRWQVLATDGHITQGVVPFRVR